LAQGDLGVMAPGGALKMSWSVTAVLAACCLLCACRVAASALPNSSLLLRGNNQNVTWTDTCGSWQTDPSCCHDFKEGGRCPCTGPRQCLTGYYVMYVTHCRCSAASSESECFAMPDTYYVHYCPTGNTRPTVTTTTTPAPTCLLGPNEPCPCAGQYAKCWGKFFWYTRWNSGYNCRCEHATSKEHCLQGAGWRGTNTIWCDVSPQQCSSIPFTNRTDCGFYGITRSDCESRDRCCWREEPNPNPQGIPWCFHA